jgi:hypothetical protein
MVALSRPASRRKFDMSENAKTLERCFNSGRVVRVGGRATEASRHPVRIGEDRTLASQPEDQPRDCTCELCYNARNNNQRTPAYLPASGE